MQGQLFTQDFLRRGILSTAAWSGHDDAAQQHFEAALRAVFAKPAALPTLNEALTEQTVIEPVLAALGWGGDWLRQVNLSDKGREDVPDYLCFADAAALAQALAEPRDAARWRHGLTLLEAKRWRRPLDRGDPGERLDPDTPSSQMLRYLSRVDVASNRRIRWAMLCNGALWRLYWQDARSRAEEYFEVDLAAALGLDGATPGPDDPPAAHTLRLFALFFGRQAFLPQPWDSAGRSLHAYARDEARLYEERVSKDLGERVFHEVFPRLADGLARGDLQARRQRVGYGSYTRLQFTPDYLDELREAALVLLYRLLFLFYAEDRLLLPTHDPRYAPYSVRALRLRVREGVDAGRQWSSTMAGIWRDLRGVFELIDVGDDDVGMPAYNGGLFERRRAPLLERSSVPDKVMAPILDALSRRTEDILRLWINYRDLSVQHLGSLYERLLEYTLAHEVQAAESYHDRPEVDRIVARPASFARKTSGSYYTHDDLVRLVLQQSVGRLCDERMARFGAQIDTWRRRASLTPPLWDRLSGSADAGQRDALDPATQMLELTVCDPAMGSGHFLVALVDYLADRVLEAASSAGALVNRQPWAAHLVEQGRPWASPVTERIAAIRAAIRRGAAEHGWAVSDAQLDDRQIVRRMILKKSVFGVDKNPMAVELAKTALWLHTFTVGAPLSFLDHHLKLGDSLHGERLDAVRADLAALGMLFNQAELERLSLAARGLAQVADLTDVDIAEVRESQRLASEAEARTAPLHALLDFWRAMRWLLPGWPAADAKRLGRLGDDAMRHALAETLAPGRNIVALLHAAWGGADAAAADDQTGQSTPAPANAATATSAGTTPTPACAALLAQARALARREHFFHWWTAFPTVFDASGRGGFDVVLGNPPWDRIKLQEVEWLAERDRSFAPQPRAADRKRRVAELQARRAPLWTEYEQAVANAEANARVMAKAGDYPLLGGGDVNLYSLFVERAQALVRADGFVALLTPSGIAADKGASAFFRGIAGSGRLAALFDFENKKVFFADIDSRFKFCTLVFGGAERRFATSRSAFFLHALTDLDQPGRVLELTAQDFELVNPNTGAAPIFRGARDAALTLRLYRAHPVLVRRGQDGDISACAWPVRYLTMFHMTNDSRHFMSRGDLLAQGFNPAPLGRWRRGDSEALPLYEGKMVQAYDHRAADVLQNPANLHRAAVPDALSSLAKQNPTRVATPQYWVDSAALRGLSQGWALGFKEITAPTNARSMIAAIVPRTACSNKLPLLVPTVENANEAGLVAALLLANLNAIAFDYVLRQKLQGQTINLFILEQLPVIARARFDQPLPAAFTARMREDGLMNGGQPRPTVADFVVPQVLALSYTAHDLAPFARDLGYVDTAGQVLPPIAWDDTDRRRRLAALDALFMHLYGLNADDAAHVLDSFPIVAQHEREAFGDFRSRAEVLAWLPLLAD